MMEECVAKFLSNRKASQEALEKSDYDHHSSDALKCITGRFQNYKLVKINCVPSMILLRVIKLYIWIILFLGFQNLKWI